jgi:hypothetical protein
MTSLKFGIIAIAAAMLLSTTAFADECDSQAAEAAAKIGGTVLPRMVIGILIEHPNVQSLGVLCENYKVTGVVAEPREKTPRAEYYETVGRFLAAAFPPITSEEASSESLKCQTMALSKEGEWAMTETKGVMFQCRSESGGYESVLVARPAIVSGRK